MQQEQEVHVLCLQRQKGLQRLPLHGYDKIFNRKRDRGTEEDEEEEREGNVNTVEHWGFSVEHKQYVEHQGILKLKRQLVTTFTSDGQAVMDCSPDAGNFNCTLHNDNNKSMEEYIEDNLDIQSSAQWF